MVSLRAAVVLALVGLVGVSWWTWKSTRPQSGDGRQEIVCWGVTFLGDDLYSLAHQFENENPKYRVVISSSVERDTTSDGQRLLSAIAGGVPPDVVFFPRFSTGEWASRGALTDLRPLIEKQDVNNQDRIKLEDYYPWALEEGSYAKPGSGEKPKLYGIPVTVDLRVMYANVNLLRQAELVDEKGNAKLPRTWEELRDYSRKLTLFRRPGDKSSGIERLGFAPNYGNSWLYLYAWQAGGDMLSADRMRVTMDLPPVVRALRFMTEMYDELGGIGQVNAFQQNLQSNQLDPFIQGRVAMKIDTDWAFRYIADFRPDMDFVIAPAPMPADQLAAGRKPVTWSGGFSLVIPATSRNRDGAFKFIQFLTSWRSVQLLEQGKREQKLSEGKLYLPEGVANRVHFERLVKSAIDENPRVPARFKQAYQVLRELMPNTLYRAVTPVGQLLWNQHVSAYEAAVNHRFAAEAKELGTDEVKLALSRMQGEVQRQLDEALRPPPPREVKWGPYFWAYGAVIAIPFVAMWIVYRQRKRAYGYRGREVGAGLMFVSPWIVGMIVLVGGPILFSILMSFTRYDVLSPARYVGIENYRTIFGDRLFYISLKNTMFMIWRIPLGMAMSLAIAVLLNRSMRGVGLYRTAFYMPVIVPLVALSLLWERLLNPSYGIINAALGWLYETAPARGIERLISWLMGSAFHFSLPLWLQDPSWSKPSLILMGLWTAGGGMIIWLAGLQSIPPQLYEAASIDGASAWRKFWHITMPMLSPYILFNLIIGLIATMQIFGEAYILTAGGPADSTLFYAYHLFKQAFQYFRMGYASALAWILFLIVLGLTLLQLWLSRRWVQYDRG
jgi:ABC-type sugar transport system permease subunit/ABC-type glycerol-3-phosphate transport system substrate-binding protein